MDLKSTDPFRAVRSTHVPEAGRDDLYRIRTETAVSLFA